MGLRARTTIEASLQQMQTLPFLRRRENLCSEQGRKKEEPCCRELFTEQKKRQRRAGKVHAARFWRVQNSRRRRMQRKRGGLARRGEGDASEAAARACHLQQHTSLGGRRR